MSHVWSANTGTNTCLMQNLRAKIGRFLGPLNIRRTLLSVVTQKLVSKVQ
jgi:hypothetical protein